MLDLAAAFEEDRVAPHAVALRDPLAHPDDPEPARLVERERCTVLREDRRLNHPDPGGLAPIDQRFEQFAPDSEAARLSRDVHAVLGHAAVAPAPRCE